LTDEEIAQLQADRAIIQAEREAQAAAEAAKIARKESAIAKLTALGLTQEEVSALL